MADTKVTTELQEFMKAYNLETLNHFAIAELLMKLVESNSKQQAQIDEIAEHTRLPDFMNQDGEWFMGGRLIDKWNNK